MAYEFYHHSYAEYLSTPVSPVPSYQSSSQSSSNSPSGSQSSGAFGDISTSSPASPYGSSPWTTILPPRNPFLDPETDEDEDVLGPLKPKRDRHREKASTIRAKELLEQTAGADVSDVARITCGPTIVLPEDETNNPILPDLSPAQYSVDDSSSKEHLDFLRRSDRARQFLAKQRAVAMLEATVGKQVDPYAKTHCAPPLPASATATCPAYLKEEKHMEKVRGKGGTLDVEKPKHEKIRETAATLRAKELLEQTAGADVSDVARITSGPTIVLPENETNNPILPDLSPAQYSVEDSSSNEHLDFLHQSDRTRQFYAKQRAVAMLEATVGKQGKPHARIPSTPAKIAPTQLCNPGSDQKQNKKTENVSSLKKEIDKVLERGATMLAVTSVQTTSHYNVRAQVPLQKPTSALTARQAAMKQYEEKQRAKAQLRAKLREDEEKFKRLTLRNISTGMENLAETTRKPREKRPEDVRDPETVAGMKCQLDIDREIAAKKKALHLMKFGSIL